MDEAVLYEISESGHIGKICLNRPDNRNSMTPELLDSFQEVVNKAKKEPQLRALIVSGKGSCFSAGADLKATLQRDEDTLPHERSFAMYKPFLSLLDIRCPVIGALNGHAVGGGFGLSLVCDIRIANEKAKYGANFTKLGLSSGMAISYLLPRIVGVSKACELLFTAALIDGKEGEKIGFCSTALPGKEVLPYAEQLAETIAKNAPLAVQYTKRNIYSGLGWAPSNAAYQESFTQSQTLTTDDASEGIKALLEKRVPTFTGR